MTPFGERLRELRASKGVNQAQMASELDVSPAYLSALEHGRRGMPSWAMIQKIIQYFGLIWDDAEELHTLAQQSKPKVTIDTTGLDPKATELANSLALRIARLQRAELDLMLDILKEK